MHLVKEAWLFRNPWILLICWIMPLRFRSTHCLAFHNLRSTVNGLCLIVQSLIRRGNHRKKIQKKKYRKIPNDPIKPMKFRNLPIIKSLRRSNLALGLIHRMDKFWFWIKPMITIRSVINWLGVTQELIGAAWGSHHIWPSCRRLWKNWHLSLFEVIHKNFTYFISPQVKIPLGKDPSG